MMTTNGYEVLAKTRHLIAQANDENRDWLIEQPTEICGEDREVDAASQFELQ